MNVALIPVRGGSKSIPLKNIKNMNGKPLVYWTVLAACQCSYIDKVYVATDNDLIKETVESFGFKKVETIGRSDESASDIASTESVMLEFAEKNEFDNIILIQATSPLLTGNDLTQGFTKFKSDSVDSVLSVVLQKRFIWKEINGQAIPVNYDFLNRPRRQEFDGYLVENGAFYITSKELLMQSKCRVSGNIQVSEMSEETYFEIDEISDWIVVEHLLKKRDKMIFLQKGIPQIKMFLTDCDGCLTDAGMYYTENGDELKKFNTKDGMGFSLLKKKGIITGIITGENTQLVRRRAEKLCLNELHMGICDKLQVVMMLCEKYGISLSEVAYVGDDINDIEVIKSVGLGCSVNNALQAAKDNAKYITKLNGGDGAIREVIDHILENNENLLL